jgi:hypothetical protein
MRNAPSGRRRTEGRWPAPIARYTVDVDMPSSFRRLGWADVAPVCSCLHAPNYPARRGGIGDILGTRSLRPYPVSGALQGV